VLDHAEVGAFADGTPPAKAFHKIHRCTLDRAHAPGIPVGAHVRLDQGGTAPLDGCAHDSL
jgi:hypothetical protein